MFIASDDMTDTKHKEHTILAQVSKNLSSQGNGEDLGYSHILETIEFEERIHSLVLRRAEEGEIWV